MSATSPDARVCAFGPAAHVDLAEYHQDRYLDRSADPELRIASGRWLIERGFIGCRGVDLLPFGRLPK